MREYTSQLGCSLDCFSC